MKIIRSSRVAMHTHLDELGHALDQSGGPWVVDEQFTLAVGLQNSGSKILQNSSAIFAPEVDNSGNFLCSYWAKNPKSSVMIGI